MLSLLLAVAQPLYASDQVTVNTSEQLGVTGTLLAAPPGSCTAAPGGALGDCDLRGIAAVTAAATATFFSDTTWSDLKEADVPLTENGNTEVGVIAPDGTAVPGGASPTPTTDIGASWVNPFCAHPYCGHLLRGDALQFDENGDGVFDDTWIDKNFNGIIDNGEIDRLRQEQFGWGETTIVRDPTDLGSVLATGNLFPAGVARDRVRLALGDASTAGSCNARVDNPACLDGNLTPANPLGVDSDYWALCDPDKFNPATTTDPTIITVADGQRALDNCLWWITSLPILANSDLPDQTHDAYINDSVFTFPDGAIAEERTEWVDQVVFKPIASFTPDHQDFISQVEVTYGFHGNAPVEKARYENGWQILQQDRDPNEDVNGTTNPFNGNYTAAPAGPAVDTYPYAFALEHKSRARARGEDMDGNPVAECGGGGPDCDGLTNPTFDPFWREQLVKVALVWENRWNQDFEYHDGQPCDAACRGSGVGHEIGFQFLTAQDVNGYFETCINCQPHVAPLEAFPEAQSRYMPYHASWNTVPTIVHAGL